MANPKQIITKDVQVGIYDSAYVARVYKDKIILITPYVRWIGNTGGYAESKESIRNQKVVDAVIKELNDDCEDSAWGIIGRAVGDEWLSMGGY